MNQLVAHQYRTGADRLALPPGVQHDVEAMEQCLQTKTIPVGVVLRV
jgi:hypothetical protein